MVSARFSHPFPLLYLIASVIFLCGLSSSAQPHRVSLVSHFLVTVLECDAVK
jgi:hypothetical protein